MRIGGRRKLFSFAGYRVADAIVAADVAQVNLDVDRRHRLACPDCGHDHGSQPHDTAHGAGSACGNGPFGVNARQG